MRRREAVRLIGDICKCIPGVLISGISLTPIDGLGEDFQLRINVALTDESLKRVEEIVKKYGMNLKEDKASLLIYAPEPIEIIA